MDARRGVKRPGSLRGMAYAAVGLASFCAAVLVSPESVSKWAHIAMLLALYIPLLDGLDFCARLVFQGERSSPGQGLSPQTITGKRGLRRTPYAVVASVHNAEPELPLFLNWYRGLRRKLWLIDDASTDLTVEHLRAGGVRCIEARRNRHKPGAIRQLLFELPQEFQAVMIIDPDTRLTGEDGGPPPLDDVVEDFLASEHAALCPQFRVRRESFLTALQDLEYSLTVSLGRRALKTSAVTSGVSLYRRADLSSALEDHSLSVYAEDLENSLILLGRGKTIVLDDRLVAETDGKRSLRDLASQRVGWAFGHLKVYGERIPELLKIGRREPMAAYQFVIYLGLLGIVLHPLRQAAALMLGASLVNGLDRLLGLGIIPNSIFTSPGWFVIAYLQYTLLLGVAVVFAIRPGQRLRHFLVVPFYFMYSLMMTVPVTIGFVNWLTLRALGRRMFDDHYQGTDALVNTMRGGQPHPRIATR